MNLGQSTNFGKVDTEHIPYPVTMSVDYIRVYQPKDAINYGCSPPDFPTADYINQYVLSLSLSPASWLIPSSDISKRIQTQIWPPGEMTSNNHFPRINSWASAKAFATAMHLMTFATFYLIGSSGCSLQLYSSFLYRVPIPYIPLPVLSA